MIQTTLKKLSCCPCGFTTLKEDIPLGTEYMIDPNRRQRCFYTCGGCGKTQRVEAVFVCARGQSNGGYLPRVIFEPL